MKRKLALALWFIGSCGAVLFVCVLSFGAIYMRRFNIGVGGVIVLGIFAAWEGFKMFRSEKRSPQL
jgi:hypothetical protein